MDVEEVDEEEATNITSPPKVQARNPLFKFLFKLLLCSSLTQNWNQIIMKDLKQRNLAPP